VQIVVRAKDRTMVAVGMPRPGNRNDIVAYQNTVAKDPAAVGHRGAPEIRGLDRKIVKDAAYRRFRRRRAVIEHVIARMKDYQVLRQCRRKKNATDYATAGVAVLHNIKIEFAACS
jgi:hypothetical protein